MFAVQAFAGSRLLWPLYVLIMIQSVLSAIVAPARKTFMPRLLPKEQLRAGIALQVLSGRVTMLIGPRSPSSGWPATCRWRWACSPSRAPPTR